KGLKPLSSIYYTSIQQALYKNTPFYIDEKTNDFMGRSRTDSGDVLITIAGSIGRAAVVPKSAPELNMNQAVALVRCNEYINPYYLYHMIQSHAVQEQISGLTVTSAISNLSLGKIKEIKIPVPSRSEQDIIAKFLEAIRKQERWDNYSSSLPDYLKHIPRIVVRVEELLGKVEEVRSLRQKALEEAEALRVSSAKAIFHELAQASTQPLRELVTVQGGGTPSKQNPFFWDGLIPWISPKDMKSREINNSIDHISEEATLKSSAKLLEAGSVLIVVRGMILAHTVPSAILRRSTAINQDMKALFPNEKITPEFLCCVFWTLNDSLLELVEKSTHDTRKLETPKLLNFKIPLPPLSEQRRIVAYLEELQTKIDTMKRLREQAMTELGGLLPSILDKAFKGEL
ncbi:restriction endonuclease subunit S, partial [Halotia wernerae UHCC 0503]|nr:restriction endonuclease subunit S [Halotia wernerae UHCC 0503]